MSSFRRTPKRFTTAKLVNPVQTCCAQHTTFFMLSASRDVLALDSGVRRNDGEVEL
jgi:hypothetical protein